MTDDEKRDLIVRPWGGAWSLYKARQPGTKRSRPITCRLIWTITRAARRLASPTAPSVERWLFRAKAQRRPFLPVRSTSDGAMGTDALDATRVVRVLLCSIPQTKETNIWMRIPPFQSNRDTDSGMARVEPPHRTDYFASSVMVRRESRLVKPNGFWVKSTHSTRVMCSASDRSSLPA